RLMVVQREQRAVLCIAVMKHSIGLQPEARSLRQLADLGAGEHASAFRHDVDTDGNVDPRAKAIEVTGLLQCLLGIGTLRPRRDSLSASLYHLAERRQSGRADGSGSVDELQGNAQFREAAALAAAHFVPCADFGIESGQSDRLAERGRLA